jgi:polysaccharide transporter, PST family
MSKFRDEVAAHTYRSKSELITGVSWISRLRQHRLARNTGALMIVQMVTYITPLISLIYLTRVLGLTLYGVVAFGFSLVQLLAVILDFGFSLSATKKISQHRHRRQYINRLLGSIFVIKLAGFTVAAAAIVAYALTTLKYADHRVFFLWTLLPLFGYSFQPIWFFSGIERMRYITVFTVTAKILGVGLILWLVTSESTYVWAIVADGVGQAVGSCIAIVLIFKLGYRPTWPRRRDVVYTIKMTAGFFLSRLAVTTYISSGVLLLGLFATPAMTGAYAIAERCYQAMQQVFGPIVQALYPYMTRERKIGLLLKISVACVGLAIFVAIAGHALAPLAMSLLIRGDTQIVLSILNVFFIGLVVHVANVMSGYPLAAVLDRTDVANRSVVYGSILYAVCAATLIALNAITALTFAVIMVVAECFILGMRATLLWPQAYRRLQIS